MWGTTWTCYYSWGKKRWNGFADPNKNNIKLKIKVKPLIEIKEINKLAKISKIIQVIKLKAYRIKLKSILASCIKINTSSKI
jgi:hypothetical protein